MKRNGPARMNHLVTDDDDHPIYYRLMASSRAPGTAVIVTMQDFDEYGYDESRWITERTFDTEDEAIEFCKMLVKRPDIPDHIKDLVRTAIPISYQVDEYLEGE